MKTNDKIYYHSYVCKKTVAVTDELECIHTIESVKLPPILKELREETGYQYKIPHGNKVRTLILEQGVCHIDCGKYQYDITIERW